MRNRHAIFPPNIRPLASFSQSRCSHLGQALSALASP
jgi:hypothetical protein